MTQTSEPMTPTYQVLVNDAVDLLQTLALDKVKPALVFMDPPDNIGIPYASHVDKMPAHDYYNLIGSVLMWSMKISPVVYLSYYWKHDLEVKHITRTLLKTHYPSFSARTIIWRFTFGQHNEHDFGSGYRPMLRLLRPDATNIPPRVRSRRQELGDSRANPEGRVPDDVWDFSRIQGNNSERCQHIPTQHPEMLLDRIIRTHTDIGDLVIDPFAGSGTTLRVCKYLKRSCITGDIDESYVDFIKKDNGL